MDLEFSPEEIKFRDEVRAFIGPSFAEEVAAGQPTAVALAANPLDPACKSAVAVRLAVAAVASVMLVFKAPEAVKLDAALDCR